MTYPLKTWIQQGLHVHALKYIGMEKMKKMKNMKK